jgi:TolA-binding protein
MSERLTKKQLKEDKFIDTIRQVLVRAQENIPLTILGLLGFVALVALAMRVAGSATGGAGGVQKASTSEKALIEARAQFLTGSLEAGRDALDEVRSKHGGSRAGREATYLLGNALYELGEYESAQQAFEDFLKKPLYDDLLLDGAALAVAACKEESGDLEGAAADYANLWSSGAHPGTRLQAALAGARCARILGLTQRASDLYQGIIDTFPDAPEAEEARFARLELKAPSS